MVIWEVRNVHRICACDGDRDSYRRWSRPTIVYGSDVRKWIEPTKRVGTVRTSRTSFRAVLYSEGTARSATGMVDDCAEDGAFLTA